MAAAGLTLVAVSLGGLVILEADTSLWYLGSLFFIQGVGVATLLSPGTTAIMASVPQEKAGVASAINNTVRYVCGALGVAVLGATMAVRYRSGVDDALGILPAGARHNAAESLGSTLGAAGQAGVVQQVRGPAFDAILDGMHRVGGVAAAVAVAVTLMVLRYLPRRPVPAAPKPSPSPERAESGAG